MKEHPVFHIYRNDVCEVKEDSAIMCISTHFLVTLVVPIWSYMPGKEIYNL